MKRKKYETKYRPHYEPALLPILLRIIGCGLNPLIPPRRIAAAAVKTADVIHKDIRPL
jgi:hypothetical protein